MQVENLINWRKLSKLVSKNGSETSIRRNNYPDKYAKEVEALIKAIQGWESEYIKNISPEKKLTIKEINNKLNSIQW